jgi:RNA polymerase sigma-70 factor (ECF subfamily)
MSLGKRLQAIGAASLNFPVGARLFSRGKAAEREHSERAAFEALIEGCWDSLWRYAYRLAGSRDDAEDLLSEALIGGFKSFAQFRGDTPFVRWMYRIVTTTYIDSYRRAARRKTVSLDAEATDSEEWLASAEPVSNDPERIVIGAMLSEPVENALASLAPEYRTVVIMADMQEMDYADISRLLEIPIGTVRSRLHRGRRILRQALAPHVDQNW